MTFLRAWGLLMLVTAWVAAIVVGAAAILVTVVLIVPTVLAWRVYVQEMREWRLYGHPRNRRDA